MFTTASSVLDLGKRSVNRVLGKCVKGVYTALVKDQFKEWDRVDTFLHSLSTWAVVIR